MLVVMRAAATPAQIDAVADQIRRLGYCPHVIAGGLRTAIAVTGNRGPEGRESLLMMPGVEDVVRVTVGYRLASRETHPAPSVFSIAGTRFGAGFTIIAGPCSVESQEMIVATAQFLRARGVRLMRAGAYKPRSSPYAFQGLGAEGLRLLAEAKNEMGIGIVTEVLAVEDVDRVAEVADVLQVGTRNMQNYALLRRLSATDKPILLKRGVAATVEEWLLAAEYIMAGGNRQVILCERGVRTFADHARNTLDLSIVPVVKHLSHLPVIIDPSHGTGRAEYVPAMSRAGLAAGADGLLVEVHPDPRSALSDGQQSLDFDTFQQLCGSLRRLAQVLGVEIM